MRTIQPDSLSERLKQGNGLRVIDVREPDEYARGHVPGARCIPISSLHDVAAHWSDDTETVLVCWSGARASQAADELEKMGLTRTTLLSGGTKAWLKAGLPTERTMRGIPLQRQVLLSAGLVLLLSFGLALANPWFLAIAVFVSAMLVVAGVTGFCPMAIALSRMPWNKKLPAGPGGEAGRASNPRGSTGGACSCQV
jgi:rhodanese-related sulfurtransferase